MAENKNMNMEEPINDDDLEGVTGGMARKNLGGGVKTTGYKRGKGTKKPQSNTLQFNGQSMEASTLEVREVRTVVGGSSGKI